jgi:hypothetical protein
MAAVTTNPSIDGMPKRLRLSITTHVKRKLHMRPFSALFYIALTAASPVFGSQGGVELNYRLRPDRNLTANSVANAITTMRVLVDRGIVAKSNGRLSSTPTTIHIISKQAFRYVTGSAQPDGSFSVEMHYLDKTTHFKHPDGREQLLPEKAPINGVRVVARVQSGGKVREGSVALTGIESSLAEPLRKMMATVLDQAASIEPLWLNLDQSIQQEVAMQLPLPGIASLNLKMRISNRLLAVDGGVARIQQIYGIDFETPAGALKMNAEGSGGGTMLYEVATHTLLSSDTGTLMKITLDTPDGVIEVQVNSKQSQTMRPTPAEVR